MSVLVVQFDQTKFKVTITYVQIFLIVKHGVLDYNFTMLLQTCVDSLISFLSTSS